MAQILFPRRDHLAAGFCLVGMIETANRPPEIAGLSGLLNP